LIHAFCVHVDLDRPSPPCDCLKHCLPEVIASFGDPALAMYAHREPLYLRALSQDYCKCIAAVTRVIVGRQSFNAVICIWTVGPLVCMRPNTQLELQSPRGCFGRNKAQHRKVPGTLGRTQCCRNR